MQYRQVVTVDTTYIIFRIATVSGHIVSIGNIVTHHIGSRNTIDNRGAIVMATCAPILFPCLQSPRPGRWWDSSFINSMCPFRFSSDSRVIYSVETVSPSLAVARVADCSCCKGQSILKFAEISSAMAVIRTIISWSLHFEQRAFRVIKMGKMGLIANKTRLKVVVYIIQEMRVA